jgi:hypothetical protein
MNQLATENLNIITDELGNPLLVDAPGVFLTTPGIPIDVSRVFALPNYPNDAVILPQDGLTIDVSRGGASDNYPLEVWRSI